MTYVKNLLTVSISFFFVYSIWSCQSDTSKATDISQFIISDSLAIEVVAHEPMVVVPVAMEQDTDGDIWIVEMPGYMRDIDANGEDISDGRIVCLKDTNADGLMDKRIVVLDSLLNPRAIKLYNGGILYTDGTALKWCPILGKAKAATPNKIEIVDSLYVIGGNIEHQPNGLYYNIDNWIYSAKSNIRYRLFNGKWQKEVTSFRGQWGISADQDGRLVCNHNSIPLSSDASLPNRLIKNQYSKIKKSNNQLMTKDFSVSPIRATAVNRGYEPKVLDDKGFLVNLTSACSPLIYYGSQLSSEYYGNAFVCAPEVNQILDYRITNDYPISKAERKDSVNAFLVSTKESFRPVNIYTGLDGYLYVVDLRKGIIQHRAYMSNYLRKLIEKRNLDRITNQGRIYRVKTKNSAFQKLNFNGSTDWINLLNNQNYSLRLLAQRKLIEKNDPNDIASLLKMIQNNTDENGLIHALWALEGMDQINIDIILKLGLKSNHQRLLKHILYILAKQGAVKEANTLYIKIFSLNNDILNFELCHNVGLSEAHFDLWLKLANQYAKNPVYIEALVSGLSDESNYLNAIKRNLPSGKLTEILKTSENNRRQNKVVGPKILQKPFDDDRTNGMKVFSKTCVSCHGMDGRGIENLAPSLAESTILQQKPEALVHVIFHGYKSSNSKFNLAMPTYIDDPAMSDQDIVDLVAYLKSSFTNKWSDLNVDKVRSLRSQ